MSFHQYQITFDENGEILGCTQLPDEIPRKRIIIVREETKNKAKKTAQDLYSLAE